MNVAPRMPRLTAQEVAAFWAKVDKSGECWTWMGQLSTNRQSPRAYGVFYVRRDQRIRLLAHRVALALTVGRLSPDSLACHHCDNPPCVRPDHLYAGTAQTNHQDAVDRNRGTGTPLGSKRPDMTRKWTAQLRADGYEAAIVSSDDQDWYSTLGALDAAEDTSRYIDRLVHGDRLPELIA